MGRLVVTDREFRDLDALPDVPVAPDVRVHATAERFPERGELIRRVDGGTPEDPAIAVHNGPAGMQWEFARIGRFWVLPGGREVRYRLHDGVPSYDVDQPLLGPVLGTALQLQGVTLLHASCVAIDGHAVAFCARSGMGKSTLAASFARAGTPLVSDDVLPLEFQDDTAPGGKASGGTVQASPYVPRIKLWEESLHAFGGDAEQYDRILSRFAKRRVEAASWGAVARDPLPLAVIYVLTPHREAARPIEINAIDEFEATMCLAASMYQAETYTDERAAFALDAAAKLPAAVPVRQVSYARSYDGLDELRAAILSDAGSLTR